MNLQKLSLIISLVLPIFLSHLLQAETDLDKRLKAFNKVATVQSTEDLGYEKMREIAIRTVLNRKWQVTEDSENLIVINLVHRRYDSTLYLRYDAGTIEIYSDSWRLARNGDRLRKEEPEGWIENLEKDFARNFEVAVFGL